jgi:hypothetical protein
MLQTTYEIRATFDAETITVYQAYDPAIAAPAVKHQQLVAPFSYNRMTWIKPSFLWMMYRSDWAQSAGQTRILRIQIARTHWDTALSEAILSTPEAHVYPDAAAWRKALAKSSIRVQWDPERGLRNEKYNHRSIQVGIGPALARDYATQWIVSIEDLTPQVHRIHKLVLAHEFAQAEALLPPVAVYPATAQMRQALGM